MERYCSTGQSPQRAVAPKEEEEEEKCSTLHLSFSMDDCLLCRVQ